MDNLWYPNKGRGTIDTRKLADIDFAISPGPGFHWEEVSEGEFELVADEPIMGGPSLESIVADWGESRE